MTPARQAAGRSLAMMALSATATAFASPSECGSALAHAGRQVISGPGYSVAFVPSSWPIPVGQHFSLALQVCADPGNTLPEQLRVDADMPVHRHGMNYRASVKEVGPGNYQANGLMFHMPGRWRFRLELGIGKQAVRLDRELDVQ